MRLPGIGIGTIFYRRISGAIVAAWKWGDNGAAKWGDGGVGKWGDNL